MILYIWRSCAPCDASTILKLMIGLAIKEFSACVTVVHSVSSRRLGMKRLWLVANSAFAFRQLSRENLFHCPHSNLRISSRKLGSVMYPGQIRWLLTKDLPNFLVLHAAPTVFIRIVMRHRGDSHSEFILKSFIKMTSESTETTEPLQVLKVAQSTGAL